MADRYVVNYVCSGNICRSPIGEVTLRAMIEEAGLGDRVEVVSSGTGDWHVGEPADPRTVQVLEDHGFDGSAHRAKQFDPSAFDDQDLILAADRGHQRRLNRLARNDKDRAKVHLARSFDPQAVADDDLEIPDPYYGEWQGFETVIEQIMAANKGIIEYIRAELDK